MKGRLGRRELASLGERAAADFLMARHYTIMERNFRCPIGEVDLVARHGEYLVFVEVRTRQSHAYGSPEESVTPAKVQKLVELAQTYIQSHPGLPSLWRIDVVAVEVGKDGAVSRLEVIENAVS